MKLHALIFCLLIIVCESVNASGVPVAYQRIADEFNIHPALLYAMAMTESNRPDLNKPWPWTINCAGVGYFFNTRNEAFNFANEKISNGIKNCDIGIMEVSWRWNSHVFESLWAAFDPYTNIRAGASLLNDLYIKHGSFEVAVGAYHSPGNRQLASAYKERVRIQLARVLKKEAV